MKPGIIAGHLPDIEDHSHCVKPHPDGLAWLKACPACAHRTNDPQGIGEKYQRRMMEFDGESVFYCLHREAEGGLQRICACYAATNRLARIDALPPAQFGGARE